MGTIPSVSHMPPYNYLYNRNVPVQDSAFYDGLDQDVIAHKALDMRYILAVNIEIRITYDHNNDQSIDYKIKTVIKVSDAVGRDRFGDPCHYILSVFGLSNDYPNKTAIVTEYPAVVNHYVRHMNAEYSCMYIRNRTTYDLDSFSKLTRTFLEGIYCVVHFPDIRKDSLVFWVFYSN